MFVVDGGVVMVSEKERSRCVQVYLLNTINTCPDQNSKDTTFNVTLQR
jgi:hypothetical protein